MTFIFCGIVGGFNTWLFNRIDKKATRSPYPYTYAQSLAEYGYNVDFLLYDGASFDSSKKYISKRLNELGAMGYSKLLAKKLFLIALDIHNGIFDVDDNNGYFKIAKHDNYLLYIYFNSAIIAALEQRIWTVLALGIILNFFRKSRSQMQLFFKLFPLVILTILLFTETNTRYLIGSLPILCVCCSGGLQNLIHKHRLTI
jgi:hypothetical protein